MKMKSLLSLLSVILLCVLQVSAYDWKIGGISYGSWGENYTVADDPYKIAQFYNLAILYVNNYTNLLKPFNVTLDMVFYDVQGSTTKGVITSFYLADTYKVRGVSGGIFSSEVIAEAQVLQHFEIPQTSAIASSILLSDKGLYPYFFRVGPQDVAETTSILVVLEEIGYKEVVLVYSSDDYGISCRTAFLNSASNYSVKATPVPISTSVSTEAEYIQILNTINNTNINVIVMYTQVGQGNSLIVQANKMGMIGSKYAYFLCSTLTNQYQFPSSTDADPSLIDGMIGVGAASGSGEVYEDVYALWNSFNSSVWLGAGAGDPGFPAWYSFDSIYVFALALNDLLSQGIAVEDITNPMYKDALFNLNAIGTTNQIIFDSSGDRRAYYDVINWKNKGANVTKVGLIDPELVYTPKEAITFYGGITTPPANVNYACPSCDHGSCVINVGCVCHSGWKGSSCDVKSASTTDLLKWLIPVIAVMILAMIGVYYWYQRKRRALVKDVADRQRSQITRGDLKLTERIGRGASGEVTKAVYRGTDVAVKRIIAAHASKSAIEEFELEVAIMCGLRHPNIILFMGSCYDAVGGEMLLVMELMARGSLNDVLANTKIPLGHDMLLHLAVQAAQGMNFLHQSTPPIIHHDLKSHNILLDDKWNARISDFGITRFKESGKGARNNSNKSLGTIYWSAPEVLNGDAITEKIDCYSFGIVLWEIFHRQSPYAGRDPMSVAIDVIRKNLRPIISPSLPDEIRNLIMACWAQNANDRPSFQEITTTLRGLTAQAPVQHTSDSPIAVRVDAPSGLVFLLSTDIIGAYSLWEAAPKAMEAAMKLHNQVMRTNMENYRGYEVSYIEHSLTIAFSSVEEMSNFCIATHLSLLNVDWPAELLTQPAAKPAYKDGLMWKGLRVKMAVVSGVPNCSIDSSSGRMAYSGPVAERVKRLLALSHNTIIFSESVVDEFTKRSPKLIQGASTKKIGDTPGSARGKSEAIHQFVIDSLAGRNLIDNNFEATNLPHMVVSVQEFDEETTPGDNSPKFPSAQLSNDFTKPVEWIAKDGDITNRVPIGKGGIGDYYKASWKGKEVALKVLVNQKLKEDDMLRLLCDSSLMKKMSHPNVLPFYSICVEPNHITVISEYESRGNLKAILADSTIQLSLQKKVKMMLDLARGIQYITSHPDPIMRIHDNLKSNNVLIGKEWEVKVADYGHSNIRELARTLTSVANIAWTAPEVLNGEVATPRIAQYSFGIIMWETFTRQVPYTDAHPIRVVAKILSGHRPSIPSDCPSSYSDIIQKCLANNPLDRPDWEEVIQALTNML